MAGADSAAGIFRCGTCALAVAQWFSAGEPGLPTYDRLVQPGYDSYAHTFVQVWAEAVLRQVKRAREAHDRDAELIRQAEYGEEWSPDEW